MLNENARPVEFHCTTPVRPSQSQRILYGATLGEHVLCELIPKLLVNKTKQKPSAILVDQNLLLNCRQNLNIAVGCIANESLSGCHKGEGDSSGNHLNNSTNSELVIGNSAFISVGGLDFSVHSQFRSDELSVQTALESISKTVDIDEPFERLVTAIQEASKSNSKAA